MARGWIKLDRQLLGHWLWEEKPFSAGQAWVDLLMMVNHEPKKIKFNGGILEMERGQTVTSMRKLADRWGWSANKASQYTDLLEQDKMLTKKRYTGGTVLTVVNYDVYQPLQYTDGTRIGHGQDTGGTRAEPNKNIRMNKNEEEIIYNTRARARELPDGFSDWDSYQSHVAELKK